MRPEAEALAAIKDAIHLAVQYLFDAEVKISKALVAQSKADALRKREEDYG